MALTLLLPTAPPAVVPRLQRGDELTYTGTVTESVDRPGTRFRRSHDLEVRVFVLDRRETWADAAMLTLLRRTEDAAVSGAVPAVTGVKPDRSPTPPAARLDLVRVHEDGTVHLLVPPGPVPLRLAADTPARVLPAPPLDAFAPCESGMFPPRPLQGNETTWAVASTDPSRPKEEWQARESGFINTEQCARLTMTQQTPDWSRPVGGQTSWQRTDEVWVSTQDGTARRVHRLIQQRDGIASVPAVRVEARYELKRRGRLIGGTYDRARLDVETAYATAAEAAPFFHNAVRVGPEPFKVRLTRLDSYLGETEPGTPYREAVLAVRRQLDAARRGEAVLPSTTAPPVPTVPPPQRGAGGQEGGNKTSAPPAPMSATPPLRSGKPAVLVFFMPGQPTTDLSLTIADALQRRYGPRLAVVPLVVFADVALGVKDRDRLKLTVPVYDGAAAGETYGVETFPRFLVLDAAGKVRWAFAGVGAETGYLVREQVDAVLPPPARAVGATGTPYRTGPTLPPVVTPP
jgi:hypothetical protein